MGVISSTVWWKRGPRRPRRTRPRSEQIIEQLLNRQAKAPPFGGLAGVKLINVLEVNLALPQTLVKQSSEALCGTAAEPTSPQQREGNEGLPLHATILSLVMAHPVLVFVRPAGTPGPNSPTKSVFPEIHQACFHALDETLPVLARPLERRRHIIHRLTFPAHRRQLFCRLSRFAVVFHARAFFRFIRVARLQELDPVLDAIFGKDEHNRVRIAPL